MAKNLFEALEFKPEEWDAKVLASLADVQLIEKLAAIEEIWRERGASDGDEGVINAYIILTDEMKKRKLHFSVVSDLEKLADRLRESSDLVLIMQDYHRMKAQGASLQDIVSNIAAKLEKTDVGGLTKDYWIEKVAGIISRQERLDEGIRPAFGSPGGKKYLAKMICGYIPDHKVYVEPFAGGGAVFFCKNPSETEVLNDKDSEIAFAYKYIQKGNFEAQNKFMKSGSRNHFDKMKDFNPQNEDQRFHRFIYLAHFSFGHGRSSYAPSIGDPANRGHGSSTLACRLGHLPKVTERLKGVHIYNKDFREIIKKHDSPDTFFYLDPPYPEQKGKYKTDLTNESIFEAVKGIKGKWIMSNSPRGGLKKLFEKFHVRTIETPRTMDNTRRHTDKELLISNFELKKSKKWLKESELDSWIIQTKKEKIDPIGPIILDPEVIGWTGSSFYAKDRLPNDADFVCKMPLPESWQIKLNRLLEKILGVEPCWHFSSAGSNWRYMPVWHLALVPTSKAEIREIGDDEPGVEKLIYEAEPRAASEEVVKQAEESLAEDKIKMFRFFYGLKPTKSASPGHRMSIEYFLGLFRPEDFKAGIMSSKKYDGMRAIIFRQGDKVEIWSEDGEEITDRLPGIIETLRRIDGDEYIIDAELEMWRDGVHMPRETMAGYIHSKDEPDDSDIVANIFTLLFHKGQDIHREPESKRQEILKGFGIPQSTFGIPDTDLKLNLAPYLVSHSSEELRKHTEEVWKKVASEGNVAKRMDAIYHLDTNAREGWIKWHANALLHGIVLKRNSTKVEGVYNYDYGILPGEYNVKPEDILEINGTKYVKVGTSFNTDEKKEPGDLIAIEFETFNLIKDHTKKDEERVSVTAWAPRYIYLDRTREPETKAPDSIEDVVKKAQENRVLQIKMIKGQDEVIYASQNPNWSDIDNCCSWQEYWNLMEVIGSPIMAIDPDLIMELQLEEQKPWLEFDEDIREGKMPLNKYPQNYAVLLNHFRGKSVHLDFRRKQNGFLEGETIMNAPEGLVTEDVKSVAQGKRWSDALLRKGKFRPDMDPNNKVVLAGKARHPLEWLNVREVAYPPGSVGATKYEWGVFNTMDEGMAYHGIQRPYFREFFLDMKHFKKQRMVERLIGVSPEWEKAPKGPTQWQAWTNMKDQTPYILSTRQRKEKRDYIPKDGEKLIPPWWEEKVKPEHRWWAEKAMGQEFTAKEKMNRLDLAFNDLIKQGMIQAQPIEIKEAHLEEKTGRFTLRFHWWMGPKVVRGVPAEDSRYELLIDSGKQALDRWDLTGNFFGDPTQEDAVTAQHRLMNIQTPNEQPFREWMGWSGAIPPRDAKLTKTRVIGKAAEIENAYVVGEPMEQQMVTKPTMAEFKPGQQVWIDQWQNIYTGPEGGPAYGNPNERLPVYIDIKDTGKAEIIEDTELFKSFKFSGKAMKGYWILKREDPKSDLWVLQKGKLPGEKIEASELYEQETKTANVMDASDFKFPMEIKFQDITYNLILTKNQKLLLNKK